MCVGGIDIAFGGAKRERSMHSIMVGRKASADGSVMTSHTCDSWYRTWMRYSPSADFPRDTVTSIYGGRMHTEYPAAWTESPKGERFPGETHLPLS